MKKVVRRRKADLVMIGFVIWLSVFLSGLFGEPIRTYYIIGNTEGLIVAGFVLGFFIFIGLFVLYKFSEWDVKRHQKPRRKG